MNRLIFTILLSAGTLCGAGQALATTFCAINTTQLQQALTAASGNGQHDTIRIATGTYPVPSGGFVYDATESGGDDRNITLSGGWTEFFGNPCGQQLTEDPWLTVFDGNDAERVLRLVVRANSSVDISLLTFFDGNAFPEEGQAFGKGGGVAIQNSEDYTGRMTIERNVFYHNSADIGGGLHITSGDAAGNGRMYIVNNLFIANHSRYEKTGASAAFLTFPDGHIYVTNNTAMYNTADGNTGGFFVAYSDILVANNNLWDNDSCDLDVDLLSGDDARLYSNNVEDLCGDPPDVESGNISVEPVYEGGLLNFTPIYYSPLVNSGAKPPTIGIPPFFWYFTDVDLSGNPRVVGPRIDIGAYENQEAELIFVNGFDPDTP